jgi:hypothetical protein
VFSHAVQPASLLVHMTDETGRQSLALTATLSLGGQVLTLTPTAAVAVGRKYNLLIHVKSLDNGSSWTGTGFFYGGDPLAAKTFGAPTVKFVDSNATNTLNAGEVVNVYFDQPMGSYGNFFPGLQAFFDADLNGSGSVGDAAGEKNFSGQGFGVFANEYSFEPGVLFPPVPSGYSSRFSFTYSGPTLTVGTQVQLAFSRVLSQGSGVQTAWGKVITSDAQAPLAVGP